MYIYIYLYLFIHIHYIYYTHTAFIHTRELPNSCNIINIVWYLNSIDYYYALVLTDTVFVTFNKEDDYSFGAQHFFNKNIGLKAGYANNWDDSDYDAYFANVSLQF